MSTEPFVAWHGDPELKERTVARMYQHRADDALVRGFYQEHAPELALGYRGCAIGCLLDKQAVGPGSCGCGDCGDEMCEPGDGWHAEVERQFGIPGCLARAIDSTFEDYNLSADAADFAVAVVESVPVGADLTGVAEAFVAWRFVSQSDYWRGTDIERGAKLIELIAAAPVVEVTR